MTDDQMAAAFNEWMREYTEEPEKFEAEFRTVAEFLATPSGEAPSYGATCAAMLNAYHERLEGRGAATS
ncbi:MAG TPA: hypothetical protein VGN75_10100 [Kaistia sp.]|jgi:hypothetical protein|nr:hypothetical protein [Kaistia sp.]